VVFGERHLRHLLANYATYYNGVTHTPSARQGYSAPSTSAGSRTYCISHLARRSPSAVRSDGIIGSYRSWGLREVKSSASLKDHYIDDIAVQIYVLDAQATETTPTMATSLDPVIQVATSRLRLTAHPAKVRHHKRAERRNDIYPALGIFPAGRFESCMLCRPGSGRCAVEAGALQRRHAARAKEWPGGE
jgi:hypothetical protein